MMKIIGCIEKKKGGRYMIEGEDVQKMNEEEIEKIRRRNFGLVLKR